jgi:3-hydroxyisobutyrate dehydrogenase-like beta-hydroxyacid dehydrogenase
MANEVNGTRETVGFVGLGAMGLPMAQNLLAAGYGLRVYNRTASKAAPLAELGATVCDTPGAAAEGVGVVLTILSDDATLEAVVSDDEGILNGLAPGAVHVSMSTIAPETSRRLSALHDLHDQAYVAAPVYGRPEVARAAKLWMLCSGADAETRKRVEPILLAMGRSVTDFGDDPAAANAVKVCGNFMIACLIETMGEAFTLAERAGVDRQQLFEFFAGSVFDCTVFRSYGKLVAAEAYNEVGFALPLGLKDVTLAQRLGTETLTPLPLAGLVRDRLLSARAKGRDHLDWAALALGASEDAGMSPDRLRADE